MRLIGEYLRPGFHPDDEDHTYSIDDALRGEPRDRLGHEVAAPA